MNLQDPIEKPSDTADHQTIMQVLQRMQVDGMNGIQELKQSIREEFTNRVDQVNRQVEDLVSKFEQVEGHRIRELNQIREEIKGIKSASSQDKPATDHPSTIPNGCGNTLHSTESGLIRPIQSQSLLRMALDKQIDELKPYYGKKQENVDGWIRKIDKLVEITRMSDEEAFMLAKLKLQGDAEKWWENKKKEIDSWTTLKSKLMDTFGSIGKTNKLELEALLHRRQQNLNEPVTKYWNDMMSHCSVYDENMSTQDRVWQIVNGALPEFRHKYENKVFDDVDQLLKALIQYEESRLRTSYDESFDHVSNSIRGSHTAVWNQQQFSEAVNQAANNQQRPLSNNRSTNMQQSNSRPDCNKDSQPSKYPN